MKVSYTARMQFDPDQDSGTILKEVMEVCKTGHVDEVMFFAFAKEQNDGHDPLDRIRRWLNAIRPWKQAPTNIALLPVPGKRTDGAPLVYANQTLIDSRRPFDRPCMPRNWCKAHGLLRA